ncbi:non-ribosomal peptide synthetase, partial [Flavobacterium sp. H122]|uniref:non-ribosomal peptide synthetase n=1 Tax=Flavobacterium sp. H122 TaxID=2529860 RepID=UPI0010AA3666
RISYIEEDTNAKVVIDSSFMSEFEKIRHELPNDNLAIITNPNSIAYVIYTSGTTGQPKGVIIEQKALINLCYWHINFYKTDTSSRAVLFSGQGFDASVWEIFPYLLSGGNLFPLTNENKYNLEKLVEFYKEQSITHSYIPPVVLKEILALNPNLESLTFLPGGEALDNIETKDNKIFNIYGPTENTVVTTTYPLKTNNKYSSTPIGSPISNTKIYVLDNKLNLVPIGVPGKLYISGIGLSRGYLNQPELTSEKFVNNPFEEGTKMYDTGDLAKWLPDGNLEFLGRKDYQVKIRGFRIELGDIETHILQFENIKQVVVDVKEINSNKILAAYYTTINGQEIDKAKLREYLLNKLPEFMIPGYLVGIDSIPLTTNGKVNRRALPGISEEDLIKKEYVKPRNETEEKLVIIWKTVLKVDEVGITDNFFELGGNSLMITQVINQINKETNTSLTFKEFFTNPSIEGLGAKLQKKNYESIPLAPIQNDYPVTASQYRLWVLSQLGEGSSAYNIASALKLKGELYYDKLELALRILLKKHEILRTAFFTNESGEVRQVILPENDILFTVDVKDVSDVNNPENLIEQYLSEQQTLPFDLEKAPLLRMGLLKISKEETILSYCMHHIISDGWSMQLLVSEMIKTYNALVKGENIDEKALSIQYKDYAGWLQLKKNENAFQASKEYWLNQFGGTLPIIELPAYKQRPAVKTYNGNNISYAFSPSFSNAVRDYSNKQGTTVFMTLLAGVNALLYRYSHQNDIIIGTPVAGREHPDVEKQLGLFLNTLALRTQIDPDKTFGEFLQLQKQNLITVFQYQDYSFDELIDKLNLKRDLSRSALFDIMVVYQNFDQINLAENNQLEGIEVENLSFENKKAKFDIQFTFYEQDQLNLNIEYNTDIYNDEFINKIFRHFENVLVQAIKNSETTIGKIDYLTNDEKERLLLEFNDTSEIYPSNKTIIDLVEEQVAKAPDNLAIVYENTALSYNELNERANQLGAWLRDKYQIKPNDLVGIKVTRSEKMIVAMLGVLKSGAAYVPIDLNYPQERIDYIQNDSNAKVILDDNLIETFVKDSSNYFKSNPERLNTSNDLAYIIYTSGTTGNPKGVMVEHKNAVDLIYWSANEFEQSKFDIVYAGTSYCFDLSIYEIFYTLSIGKTIRLLNNNLEIGKYAPGEKDKVLINTVPSVIGSLLEEKDWLAQVGILNMAGEALPLSLVEQLPSETIDVYNLYGPSEDTTYSTYYKVNQINRSSVPIGKPIANTRVYLLDEKHQIVPIGVTGTIYISGSGLTRGYLNKPELTEKKYIDNPFEAGTKMYDTGDLGRWLQNGDIEFLGRNDHQVKIRGFRIELEEIETVLNQYSVDLKQSVILPKSHKEEIILVAYYVSNSDFKFEELKSYLNQKLPAYMIPAHFVRLDAMPLTPNGKIDRKALPDFTEEIISRVEYVEPKSSMEKQIATIWQNVLNIEKVGVTDSFFDLGGTSISAIKVVNLINKKIEVNFPVNILFQHSTINELVRHHLNTFAYTSDESFNYGNQKADNSIFAFPPILGYGNAYMDLFSNDADYKVTSFNFLEDKNDLIDYYANKVNELQPSGEILLFGWSSGGILCYEVAAYLINQLNRNVSRIVMFDSVIIPDEKLNESLIVDTSIIDDGSDAMKNIIEKTRIKQLNYIEHLKKTSYNQKLPTELIQIYSKTNENKESFEDLFETVIYIEGTGAHHSMLEGANLKANKKLLETSIEEYLDLCEQKL